MEPGTGLTILGTAIGSAKLLEKLLGPTADYLGGEIKGYAEKGYQNLGRIFNHARKVLGNRINEPGQVPPKVLKGILDDGYFCEDELSAQYFGGVLASSRSGVSRDDRGASFINLIGKLSTYQVRSHFIFYTVIKMLCHGRTDNLGLSSEQDKFKMYIPLSNYCTAMEFHDDESPALLLPHIMNGLTRENLISQFWQYGSIEHLNRVASIRAESQGIVYRPSAIGFELYLWVHGHNEITVNDFLLSEFETIKLEGIKFHSGCKCYAPEV